MRYLVAPDQTVAGELAYWIKNEKGKISIVRVKMKMRTRFKCFPLTEIEEGQLTHLLSARGEGFIFKLENGFVSRYAE